MLLGILVCVIIAGGGCLYEYLDNKYCAFYTGYIVAGIFFGLLTSVISVVCWVESNEPTMDINNPISCVECYGVNDVVGVEGHFALGSGSVESEMYLFYYVKGEFGGYKIAKTEADNVEIIEREDSEPIAYLKTYEQKVEYNLFFGIGDLGADDKKMLFVPKGTIKVNFNIDLV